MNKLDTFLEKVISRKLLVWIFSTIFLVTGLITADQWVAIALGYVGVQGFTDLAVSWKAASNVSESEQ
ncbi:hypothetical protein OAT10_00300 [Luminiphilus sp.]|nr:hypothetical protein [Luminiphilus sp.]